jgi:pyrroline-5-carboxylate reductase
MATPQHIAALRESVTSPGGTTASAVYTLQARIRIYIC